VALNSSFVIAGLFLMFLPEDLLFMVVFPIIFYTIKLLDNNSLKNYLLLSLFLGIAGLSKYTAVLFIPPILLFVFLKKRVDLFLNYKFIILILISIIIISPVIIWNINHDWISFTYQSSHVVGSNTINFKSFGKNIITQLLAFSPFLSFIAFYGLYKAIKSKDDLLLLLSLIGAFIFLFFLYSSLYKNTLPHWNSVFYVLLIPIGIAYLFENKAKLTKILIIISLSITILLHFELIFKFIPAKDYQSMHRDIYGWPKIINEASKYGNNFAVTNWTVASRALYYSLNKNINLFLIDKKYDQFDIWQKQSPLSKDLIFINTHFFKKDIHNYVYCDEYKDLTKFDILLNNKKVNTVNLILCKNYKGIK
jgi:4-amino-4-deoxy-L-arabinose transferase-like glycosyltransferase